MGREINFIFIYVFVNLICYYDVINPATMRGRPPLLHIMATCCPIIKGQHRVSLFNFIIHHTSYIPILSY